MLHPITCHNGNSYIGTVKIKCHVKMNSGWSRIYMKNVDNILMCNYRRLQLLIILFFNILENESIKLY